MLLCIMKKVKLRFIPIGLALIAGGIVTFPAWNSGQSQEGGKKDKSIKPVGRETLSLASEDAAAQEKRVSEPIGIDISGAITPVDSITLWRERPEVVHSEEVEIPGMMIGNRSEAKLLLPLPGGESLEVARWFESRHGSGQFSISGEIGGGENGLFSMARSGDSVSGVISSPSAAYEYRGSVGGSFYVAEIDRSALSSCGGCLDPGTAAASGRASADYEADEVPQSDNPQGADDEIETIDIMIVYTDDVERSAGGQSGAEADILSTVGLSNQRFRTSNANVRLRVTTMREVEYDERGDASADLDAITREDGVIDQVQAWRDADGADLVAMSVANMDKYAGLAWLGGNANDSEFAIYSVTLHNSLNWAFTHEIGHNLGCNHDRQNSDGGGFRNYSYGYRFKGAGGNTYRTQMAYDPGIRLDQFSNPDIQFDGRPTGSSGEDNARSIRASSKNVAAFRERAVVSGEGPTIDKITVVENSSVSSNTFDGEMQPGEDVRISFDVVNPFDIELTNVRLRVSAVDEFIEVVSSSSGVPDMAAGGTVFMSQAIRLRISGEAPRNFETSIRTAFTSDQGTWTTTANLFIIPRPIDLQIASFTINDKGTSGRVGNDNGIAEPGEEFDFRINVVNRGSSVMTGSEGTLRFGDNCVRRKDNDDALRLFSIAAGAERASSTYRVIASDCPRGTRVPVRVDVVSEETGSYSFEKVLVLGELALGAADEPITVVNNKPVRVGEVLLLSPRVKNTGDAIATDVTGAIIELDAGLRSESDVPLEFGTINPGAEVGPSRAKTMSITRYAPVGSEVGFMMEYQSEGEVWVIPYGLMVEPPSTPPMSPEVDFKAEGGRLGVMIPQTHNGMAYALEWSADMASWEAFGDSEVGTGDALSMNPELPEAAVGAAKIFVRVVRTMPDPA